MEHEGDEGSEEEAAEREATERRDKERAYSLDDVQRALRIMVARPKVTGEKVSPADAARAVGQPQMAWKVSQLARRLGQLPDDQARFAQIEGLSVEDVFPAKGPKPSSSAMLTPEESLLIKAACDWAMDSGFPLRRAHVHDMIVGIVKDEQREEGAGRPFSVSTSSVKRWMKKNCVGKFSTSSIAQVRAAKSTPELRDAWFGKIRRFVEELNVDLLTPYKSIDEWPNVDRFTMDEDGVNTTKHRDPALCSINPHADGMHRLFEVGLEKMAKHASDVMVTRGDGEIMTSMLVKERGGVGKKRKKGERLQLYAPSDYDWLGLRDEGAPDGQTLRIGLAVTPNGSMVLELFEKWCHFFVHECLEPGQGTRQRPVLLFLDGHASRWTVAGLGYLREHHVYPICVPSHTTIWSSPNDAGPNASWAAVLGRVVMKSGASEQAAHGGTTFNILYREAQLLWRKEQADRLKANGTNAITEGWDGVGLRERNGQGLNKHCCMWTAALRHFGNPGSMLAIAQRVGDASAVAEGGGADNVEDGFDERGEADKANESDEENIMNLDAMRASQMLAVLRRMKSKSSSVLLALRLGVPREAQQRGAALPGAAAASAAAALISGSRLPVAATAVYLRGQVRIQEEEASEDIVLTHAQLDNPADPVVQGLRDRYILADQPLEGAGSKKDAAKARKRAEFLRREATAEEGRRLYEADEEALLLKFESDVGTELLGDSSLSTDEAVRRFKEKHRAHVARMRDHYQRPPPRVINGILVYDAVALTLPRLLVASVQQRVAELLTGRLEATATERAEKHRKKQRVNRRSAPDTRTGLCDMYAATTDLVEQRHQADLADEAIQQAKRDAKAAKLAEKRQAQDAKKADAASKRELREAQMQSALDVQGPEALRDLMQVHNGDINSFIRRSRKRASVLIRWYATCLRLSVDCL